MKKVICLLVFTTFLGIAYGQAPQGIPYQAVARNSSGAILVSQPIRVRFTIRDSLGSGTVVYQETFNPTTTALGLFNVNVGTGSVVTGTFATINWGHNSKFMQVEMDPTGGTSYTDMGTQQMMSVPYALYAGTVGTSSSGGTSSTDEFLQSNFGDASDSDMDINSASFSSGPITNNALTRDAYFNSLTLSGGNLATNGYRIFIKGVLKRKYSNKIYWNGNHGGNGSGGNAANSGVGFSTGGAGGYAGGDLPDGTLKGGLAGGSGVAGGGAGGNNTGGGNGSNAVSISRSNCIGNSAVAGGAGGSGIACGAPVYLGGGGGGSSPAGVTTKAIMKPRIASLAPLMADWNAGILTPYQNATAGTGGGGGGGGGGFSTSFSPWNYGATGGGGGGAGSNSGTFFIQAYSIVDSGTGVMFEFRGGNGGNGGNGGTCNNNTSSPNGGAAGGGGGGAGGNGGAGVLIYVNKTDGCVFDLSGGNGGIGGIGGTGSTGGAYPHPSGANGSNGNNGASGVLYEFRL